MQNILADFNHDLGQPILRPGIIPENLTLLVVLVIDFALSLPASAFRRVIVLVILQAAHAFRVPDR